jgi:tetratricopeptide (TPR) repeat protein
VVSRRISLQSVFWVATLLWLSQPGVAAAAGPKPNKPTEVRKQSATTQSPKARPPVAAAALASGAGQSAMLDFLIAELASQREGAGASEAMITLAKRTRNPSIAARAVELAVRQRDVAAATRASALWLELDPDSQAPTYLADLIGETKTLAAATGEVRKLIAASEDKRPILAHLNVALSRHSEKSAVRAAIDDLTQAYQELPEASYSRGWAAHLAGDAAAALNHANRTLEKRADWEKAAVLKFTVLKRRGITVAHEYAGAFLQTFPNASEFRLAFARDLAGEKRFKEARLEFDRVAKAKPNDAIVAFSNALLAQQLEEWEPAVAEYQRALALNYRDEDAVYTNLSLIAENRKQFAEAREWLTRIEGREAARDAGRRLALLTAKLEGLAQGREILKALPALTRPERVQNALTEGQMLREAKLYDEAFSVLNTAATRYPKEVELMYDLAMAAEKVGKYDVLETNLRALIEQKPDFSHAYNALGYTFAERGKNLAEAKALIEKAIALSPDDPFILDSLGWVHYRMGNLVEAATHLSRAYEVRRDPEIAAHLSEVLWVKGRRDEAMAIVSKGLKEHPEHELLTSVLQKFKP